MRRISFFKHKSPTNIFTKVFNSSSPRPRIHHRRLLCEPLEDRRLLSVASPEVELYKVSPALFVENQGQWANESVRFVHQGDGANVALTDAGPVFQVFRQQENVDSAAPGQEELPGLPDERFHIENSVT